MHLNIPIYDTCIETEGSFFYLVYSLKKLLFVFQNSSPFGRKHLLKMMEKTVSFVENS